MPDQRQTCEFRFHGRLESFIAPRRRGVRFTHAFDGSPALKDPVEALGVPHTEVGEVLLDGTAAALDRRLQGGERVEVFPVTTAPAGDQPRFVLDVHLGRLAGYLRLIGIDTWYRNDTGDDELATVSAVQVRTLLSRDIGLLKRSQITSGAFVYSTDPRAQLREVIDRFGLQQHLAPFTRCVRCNGRVDPIAAADAEGIVPPKALRERSGFGRCADCEQVYWRGTHEARLRHRLQEVGVHL
ncbi:Mut7-C RNAse domain-containing protein [Lysobacter korlensis]|uniref:Mut7-C RNAse domain-containing protein n=1 Tax=Lysobacter korlensis TaxID=553636 RepID=A0ABV6RQ53_9GAMM